MGKVKKKRKTARAKPYERKESSNGMDAAMEEEAPPLKRGALERRQHGDRRRWKREESLLRQKMKKLSKKVPNQAAERKKLLLSIKERGTQLRETHERELAACCEKSAEACSDELSESR